MDFVQKPKTSKLKVIITARDYVKQQVIQRLDNSRYKEVIIDRLQDKDIEAIILNALPNLQYHSDIKGRIIDLAKGNARVALMATYSVTPDSETNYLSSPVLLYEKYFKKIADELEAFSKPITLKTLAIVSFFGVLDRSNVDLSKVLSQEFDIDWGELWETIIALHNHEVLDLYSNEVVKVSDQVLATYAFYKCFIDTKSSLIDYGQWLSTFIKDYPHKVKSSLVDINNTFNYDHIKDLVLPHLENILVNTKEREALYSFYSIFWFYKGYDTLAYIRQWIKELPIDGKDGELTFSYNHNDHTRPSKYFELLVPFWGHSNELLKPSLELGIDLVSKQNNRIPEFLKFINDYFSYRLSDVKQGYQRQRILLDVLLNEKRSSLHEEVADGTFLNIAETLLGWRFTEYGPSKGLTFHVTNFHLYNSPDLLELRSRILKNFIELFEYSIEQSNKILEKIIYPGVDIDKNIYKSELPIYQSLITEKLSIELYNHCKFVKRLAKKIFPDRSDIPTEWKSFIDSEIMKLTKFLKTEFDDSKGKSWKEREQEKREIIRRAILSKEWYEIELLLLSVDSLYKQQIGRSRWQVDYAISEIFIAISKKSKTDIDKALRMFFSKKLSLPLQPRVLNFILNDGSLSGKEIAFIINEFDFEAKPFWTLALLNALPEDQVDLDFVKMLVQVFRQANGNLPFHRMADYVKFDQAFGVYKKDKPGLGLDDHNIISYLTQLLLERQDKQSIDLGFHFCQECAQYLTNHVHLLKQAYILLKTNDIHFDYDGKELEAVLDLDPNFFIVYLEQKAADTNFLLFKLEDFKLSHIWSLPNYEDIVNNAINIIIAKTPIFSNWEHPSVALFTFENPSDELLIKAHNFINDFIKHHYLERQHIMMIMNVVLHRFSDQFVKYLEQFLRLNKDVEVFKSLHFDKGGIYTGSRVPKIQRVIELCTDILMMIKSLPDVLDYIDHIKYLDQYIGWLQKDIKDEQKREFQETYE
ncbi:hypothetical protein [Pontibacter chinhatensis]|uniref:hypothetical protein n=1 Tax=Pontibacter chinhatensis TaxID=1436961 RepID=UPI0011144CEE|nr:hypothetical protein [Pontibacter chinhatensis]